MSLFKSIKLLGLALVAILAVGATSASAHEFIASSGAVGTKVEAEAIAEQDFTTGTAAEPNVICKKLKTTAGTVKEAKSETQEVTIQYEECTAHDVFSTAATISPAQYLFMANGNVKILKPIEIKTSLGTQTVSEQEVGTITYVNKPANEHKTMPAGILLDPAVTGIHSTGFLGTSTTGTYKGSSLSWATGGTTEWK